MTRLIQYFYLNFPFFYKIDMIKVLFVCLGNICRSPLAEAIFKHKIKSLGLEKKILCDSAGTSDFHIGELPDERTIHCALRNGLSISHRGRQINRTDFREFDYIIGMDETNISNLNQLKTRYNFTDKPIYLMRNFVPDWEGLPVPDPYYGNEESFEEVYKILDIAIESFLEKIKITHQLYA
jgi:protein-tyrosine phosphatase